MPNLRDIRRRIRSVQSTQQITKAMKMVAAAKLRRAQESMIAARPYSAKMLDVLESLASRCDQTAHPLLQVRPEKKVFAVIVTADRGLCAGFNTNILRFASQWLRDREAQGAQVTLVLVGRKGVDFYKRRPTPIEKQWTGLFQKVRYEDATTIALFLAQAYTEERCDAIYLIYNQFKSVIAQQIVADRLLPIPRQEAAEAEGGPDYLYEPSEQALFESLLSRHVTFQIFHALLESGAAEHGARMTAMEGATNNARDMIDRLTLYANRVRQAAITKEIIEIVSGAQALG
ncbi:MAG: ATP synthase F1 subunit gamma [Acidobacteria bacterium 37-65-4]|nr:MAG: ATP synthase F1 subunit gamma [Acidobacteria bacterium 37-65-4]